MWCDPNQCCICGDSFDSGEAATDHEQWHLEGAQEDLENAREDLRWIRRDVYDARRRRQEVVKVDDSA